MTLSASSDADQQTVTVSMDNSIEVGRGPIWGTIDTIRGTEKVYVPASVAGFVWADLKETGDLSLEDGPMYHCKVRPNPKQDRVDDVPWMAVWVDVSDEGIV